MRVKCLAQEHNTISPARSRTRTARSGDERTNHEATAPLTNEALVILADKLASFLGELILGGLGGEGNLSLNTKSIGMIVE